MEYVRDIYKVALDSGQLTNFGKIAAECARILNKTYGGYWLPVTNGSAALEVVLSTLPKTVKRIAVPNFTFSASIQAIIRAGKIPVIFQCNRDLEINTELLRRHNRAYDAVLAVVPFGRDYYGSDELKALCSAYGKTLLWDRAGAFGSADSENINAYSLHASKGIPIGEGGLIRFPDFRTYYNAKRFSCFGFDDEKICHDEKAFNFKMDELRASVLHYFLVNRHFVVLRKKDLFNTKELYRNGLKDYILPHNYNSDSNISLIVFPMKEAKKLCSFLNENKIVARQYYSPLLNEHPAFKKYKFYGKNSGFLKTWVALPSDVSQEEVNFILLKIKEFYRSKKR